MIVTYTNVKLPHPHGVVSGGTRIDGVLPDDLVKSLVGDGLAGEPKKTAPVTVGGKNEKQAAAEIVKSAQAEAETILSGARAAADQLIADANAEIEKQKAEAVQIVDAAKAEAEKIIKAAQVDANKKGGGKNVAAPQF